MNLDEKGYRLVFEERFDGGLEKNNWTAVDATVKAHAAKAADVVPTHVNMQESVKHAGSNMHYNPANVAVKDGGLVITGAKEGGGYAGGRVECNGFVFRYGYVEVETELPAFQKGVWPVFSVTSTAGEMYKAIFDFINIFGDNGQTAAALNYKWTDAIYETPHQINMLYGTPDRMYPADGRLSNGRHTFGFEWTKDAAIYYCDGVDYCHVDLDRSPCDLASSGPMSKLTAELSIGLPRLEAPESDAKFPTEYKICSVRLYQNDSGMLIKRS